MWTFLIDGVVVSRVRSAEATAITGRGRSVATDDPKALRTRDSPERVTVPRDFSGTPPTRTKGNSTVASPAWVTVTRTDWSMSKSAPSTVVTPMVASVGISVTIARVLLGAVTRTPSPVTVRRRFVAAPPTG